MAYTTQRAADVLGVTRRAVRQWIESGKIKATQHAGRWWVIEDSEVRRMKSERAAKGKTR